MPHIISEMLTRARLKGYFMSLLAAAFTAHAGAQINVFPNQTALALARKLAGPGVNISNTTLNCAGRANGIFTVTSSNIGLDSGIVLTTGAAATQGSTYGVNGFSAYLASNKNNRPGDPQLDPLAGQNTLDACSLEFDVVPLGDSIHFDYIFSSEEYINAVCGPYNDAFAFFISGPGISGTENIALVPGTNIPVTINTINNGIAGSIGDINNCTAMGTGSPFTAFYTDNVAGSTLTHRGFTKVLQAVHSVTPCAQYHLKIAIADAGNDTYDSGVFLRAGSLQSGNLSVQALPPIASDTIPFCVKGCLPGHFRIKRTTAPSQPQIVRFIKSGTAVSGVDYAPFPDSVVIPSYASETDVYVTGLQTPAAGTRILTLSILSPFSCSGISNVVDTASLPILDSFHISINTPAQFNCAGDTVHLNVTGDTMLSYHWSPGSALSDSNIMSPVAFPSAGTTYVVVASLPGTSCAAHATAVRFDLKLSPVVSVPADTNVCFHSSLQLQPVLAAPNGYYSFQWNGPGGYQAAIESPLLTQLTSADSGDYRVTATIDTNGCTASSTEAVIVHTPPVPGTRTPLTFCLNTMPDTLVATGTDIRWYLSATDTSSVSSSPWPATNAAASYQYFVTQTIDGCESPKEPVSITVARCCDGNIFIPNAFTPNNDGRNDFFHPLPDYGYTLTDMHVYDRWGQEVYSGLTGGWNGTLSGKPLEPGTYFYFMTFHCIMGGTEQRHGDVQLIR